MTAKRHLRIDSHVVIQLGAELISDSEQALLELVKNAYDGDATKCVIDLEPEWDPDEDDVWHGHLEEWKKQHKRATVGRIVVKDNGTGIDDPSVENGWLFISASLKRNAGEAKVPTLKRGRIPVGDKGLGRLATMRLGEVLLLRTMVEPESQARLISFAWSAFSEGSALELVDVKSSVGAKLKGRAHGTNVEILGLLEPDYWIRESNINGVITKLSSLISPFESVRDFQVTIRSGEQEHDLQAISSEALNFSSSKFEFSYQGTKLKLKAYIAKSLFRGGSGQANRQVFDELLADKNLREVTNYFKSHTRVAARNFTDLHKEPGGWLFSLEEEIDWNDIPRDPKLPGAVDPGPFHGEIYNFLFNDHTKEQLVGANVPLGLLQGMTTIGMFRDGFRVRMNDDWLELAKGVTSGGFFQLRPRNVIGYFSISNKDNRRLVEKSDREGFVDNESWRGFMTLANRTRKFSNDSLEAVRTAYDEYKNQKRNQSSIAAGKVNVGESNDLLSEQQEKAQSSLRNLIIRNDGLSERVAETKRRVSDLRASSNGQAKLTTIVEGLDEIEKELDGVRGTVELVEAATRDGFAAAGGIATAHEQLEERNLRLLDAAAVGLSARALVHEINTHLLQLNRGLAAITRANNSEPNDRVTKALGLISGVVRELRKSISAIDPLVAGSRSLKDVIDVYQTIEQFSAQRQNRIGDAQVTFEISGSSGIKIWFSKSRFIQILENLLQNSLYWIVEQDKEIGSGGRIIKVEVDDVGFTWSDGAKGILPAVENTLFDPYVTEKPDSKGQGLGLFIVNSFLQAERCSISLLLERNRFQRRYVFKINMSGAVKR
ncbi:sensor histidine kinase [Rhodoferax ferrireducens]|uniref:sensor histidine kinase n=1 Tax=Rhodoferax ferrireducens TaxID=192843 RepID=UPI00298EA131|nr:sensor histidine kinase [Rhodoferax ferrireducens]WPC66369.1 sensor histidine kinase [Rhodoferax ferrireducens]